MMQLRRRSAVALLLLALAGGAYLALARPWTSRVQHVSVEVIAKGPVVQALALNGRIAASMTVNVRSTVPGQTTLVAVGEGDHVVAGQILARLDDTQAGTVVDEAVAALAAGTLKQQQAQADNDRAQALGDNATRAAREDARRALAEANTQVVQLQAALGRARSQLAQYTITAPMTGVVLDSALDPGQVVDTQATLFTIADAGRLVVETDVDELYSSRMAVGLRALLQPSGEPSVRPGTVIFVAPRIDPATGGREIKLAFSDPIDLPVGLTVNVNVVVSELADAISVPRTALIVDGAQSRVLVVEGGRAVARSIQYSDWPAERVLVTSGLQPGDAVILDPGAIQPGQAVEAR